jgi:hypothetical protein
MWLPTSTISESREGLMSGLLLTGAGTDLVTDQGEK